MSQSARRMMLLLNVVARSTIPIGLIELARATELDKTTASRLLNDLEDMDYISRDLDTKKFTVGNELRILGANVLLSSPFIKIAHPYLEKLRDITGETVFLHMKVRHERVCLASADSNAEIRQVSTIGEMQPLYAIPSGKVMLAFLEDKTIEILLEDAQKNGYERESITEQLDFIRKNGYLSLSEDKTPHVSIISVAIFDPYGASYSLTVAGPKDRWTIETMQKFLDTIHLTGQQLSTLLGGTNPSI